MSNVDIRMEDARVYIATHAPYFLDAVLSLIPYETKEVGTFAVTPGMVMAYNPDYVLGLTDKQVATRIWHEVHHVLRESFTREICTDHDTRNLCQDLAINSSGKDGPWDFGPDGVLPARYGLPEGLTAEEYFALLPPSPQQPVKNGVCSGSCGGIAGNGDKEFEAKLDAKLSRSTMDKELLKKQVAHNIREHGRKAGKMPAGWEEWVEAILAPPKISWATKFRNVYRDNFSKISAGRDDYSLSRISKRTYAMEDGAIRPSLIQYAVEVGIILDTSASMDVEKQIRPALREARGVILQSGCDKVWFMQIDAALGVQPKRVSTRDLAALNINGRGGTDFRPAFEAAKKLKPQPRLLIYCTDGIGPAPEKKPKDFETIWCLMGEYVQVPATWGKVIYVES